MIRPVTLTRFPLLRGLLLATISAAYAVPLGAQGLLSGELTGTVRDSAGLPVAAAEIAVIERALFTTRQITADADGSFQLRFLPAGTYEVVVEQLGYRPVRFVGVRVGAGGRVRLAATLMHQAPPVTRVDTVDLGGAARGGPVGFSELVAPLRTAAERSLVGGGAAPLETEGLPSWMGIVSADGFGWRPPRHQRLEGVLPLLAPFDAFGVGVGGPSSDAALPDFGGRLAGSGIAPAHPAGLLAWADGGFASASEARGGDASASGWRAGLLGSVRVRPDTARLVIGVQAVSLGRPFGPPLAADAVGQSLAATAADSFGTSIAPYRAGWTSRTEAATGFARLDWMLTSSHSLSVIAWGGGARVEGPDFGAGRSAGVLRTLEAEEAAGYLMLTSRLTDRVGSEFRLGGSLVARNLTGAAPPLTTVASHAAILGTEQGPARSRRSDLSLTQVLHARFGDHSLKGGLDFEVTHHELDGFDLAARHYAFGDTTAFAAGVGLYEAISGATAQAGFTTRRRSLFLQDRWHLIPGLVLVAGIRRDRVAIPERGVRQDAAWLERAGLDNTVHEHTWKQVSPRVALEWDIANDGRWLLAAAAGAALGELDPAAYGELVQRNGRQQLVRSVGSVGWNTTPTGTTGRTLLTMAGPGWRGPREQRGDIALRMQPAGSAAFRIEGGFRHHDFLMRRHDINLQTVTGRHDQYGRPVYAPLVNHGGMVAPAFAANRRIETYDRVSALDPDGYSTWWGITAGTTLRMSEAVTLSGEYTFSRAEDNWLTGRFGGVDGQLSPFPDSLGGADWAEGRSDYDIPHRLSLGIAWRSGAPRGLSLAVLYRYRSGYPFTAGFRPGVDANGDGSGWNDPAFVDDTLSGMGPLLARWPCLEERQGGFARRNACRQEGVHSLDLRASLAVGSVGRSRLELYVDGINLIATLMGAPDRALFLVDPGAIIAESQATGTVRVPLLVNPGFGRALPGRGSERLVRFGMRIGP
jgi:hypothetical protein